MASQVTGELNVFESAEARFEIAAKKLGLEQGVYRFLKCPEREITVYIPVALDSGRLEVFTGYRVLHSTVRGPGKGGIRFAPERFAGRSPRAGRVDDLEMRGRQHSLRRREGRSDLRSVQALESPSSSASLAAIRPLCPTGSVRSAIFPLPTSAPTNKPWPG